MNHLIKYSMYICWMEWSCYGITHLVYASLHSDSYPSPSLCCWCPHSLIFWCPWGGWLVFKHKAACQPLNYLTLPVLFLKLQHATCSHQHDTQTAYLSFISLCSQLWPNCMIDRRPVLLPDFPLPLPHTHFKLSTKMMLSQGKHYVKADWSNSYD